MWRRDLPIALVLALIGLVLVWVLWGTLNGQGAARLAELALGRVPESGVSNPVTAVLLNFRAYDTLLELAVLLAAILGIWSTGPAVSGFLTAGPALQALTALVVPLLVLSAGYLLWVGGYAPGGAFQAGALLGAAGVILRLSGRSSAGLPPLPWLRLVVVLGVLVFASIGLGLMTLGADFLTFPPTGAKWLILVIEAAATLSIGATLAAAYLSGEPLAATPPGGGKE